MLQDGSEGLSISAPGNILLFGGYHVLSPGGLGVIVGTDSRIYVTISATADTLDRHGEDPKVSTISVVSSQFADEQWVYCIGRSEKGGIHGDAEACEVTHVNGLPRICFFQRKGEENMLIGQILYTSLMAVYSLHTEKFLLWLQSVRNINITILADNDFYSQRNTSSDAALETVLCLPKFSFMKSTLRDTVKTGLGSSSALVSSLSFAVICYIAELDVRAKEHRKYCHSVAQLAHFISQSLLGSGADVASAFFGSHVYVSPDKGRVVSLLSNELKKMKDPESSSSTNDGSGQIPPGSNIVQLYCSLSPEIIKECVELISESYDLTGERTSITIPPGLLLVSLDVSIGTKSPGCSRRFLDWLESNRDTYDALALDYSTKCQEWISTLNSLLSAYSSDQANYNYTLRSFSLKPAHTWATLQDKSPSPKTASLLVKLVALFAELRGYFKKLGILANLSTEPEPLSLLIDYLSSLNGVMWTGTTGAGGYDAISLVVLAENVPSSKDEEIAYRMRSVASIHKSALEWLSRNSDSVATPGGGSLLKYPLPLFDGASSYFSSLDRTGICVEPKPPFSLTYNMQ